MKKQPAATSISESKITKQHPPNKPKQTSSSKFKVGSSSNVNANNNPKHSNYLQISNQQFLRRNLMLLGVTEPLFFKQTKLSLQSQFFPKHQTNPTGTKPFFYISFVCLQNLTTQEQIQSVKMWYPPRTVNQQLQYKKAFFKAVQNLETIGRLPKNILVSKGTIMGDSSSGVLVQFLRFLSQMALRHQFLEKYSKRQRLIQIACNHSQLASQNNINRFYIYPFVPSSATSTFDHPSLDLDLMNQVYHDYIKIYLKKLVKLRTKNITPILSEQYQKLMRQYMEQKQLSQTLKQKIPPALLSQNRAFDRRRIIDQHQQIWNQFNKIQCNFIEQKQVPVLEIKGQIDKILQNWQPVKGISNIIQANSMMKNLPTLKKQMQQQINKFKQLSKKIQQKIQQKQK